MRKIPLSSQNNFFPEIDPKKKPNKPEQFPEDYDDNLEDCVSCGKRFEIHSTKDIVLCALNELRGGIQT